MTKKFVKKFKKRIPWFSNLSTLEPILELTPTSIQKKKISRQNICIYCRGTKLLCGKSKCPILVKMFSFTKVLPLINKREIEGSSPPALFIGRFGYPYVNVGPLVPPYYGDTLIMDTPEKWHKLNLQKIIDFRFSLVRGKKKLHIRDASKGSRIVSLIQEIALSKQSVDSNMMLKKEPKGVIIDDKLQPMGPGAPLEKLDIHSMKTNQLLEKVYEDDDLKALHAVKYLYERKVPVSAIVRGFSAGLLGLRYERRFVPTRWSITAVDSMVSRQLINEKIKRNPVISEYMVFEGNLFGDKFVIIMFPESWSYEFIEAWYPGTTWNPSRDTIAIGGDWEPYWGRTAYAQIGGCYYAARLAVTEYLSRIGKQAKVLILRESYPDHILPLGVWHVREGVRLALKARPFKSSSFVEVTEYVSSRLKIPMKTWYEVSRILRDAKTQTKLTDWLS